MSVHEKGDPMVRSRGHVGPLLTPTLSFLGTITINFPLLAALRVGSHRSLESGTETAKKKTSNSTHLPRLYVKNFESVDSASIVIVFVVLLLLSFEHLVVTADLASMVETPAQKRSRTTCTSNSQCPQPPTGLQTSQRKLTRGQDFLQPNNAATV